MWRLLWAGLIVLALLGAGAVARAGQVGSATFTPPSGWTVSTRDGTATLTPPGGVSQGLMLILPDQAVTGDAQVWFTGLVRQLSGDGTLLTVSEVRAVPGTGLLLSVAAVQVGAVTQQRAYAADVRGPSANVFVLVAPSQAAFPALQPLFLDVVKSGAAPVAAGGGPAALSGPRTPLPDVKPMNAAQFMAAGGNPELAVIPDEFRCYQERRGSSLSPELAVQVLPGGKYRTPFGSGTVTAKKGAGTSSSLIRMAWSGGPLNGAEGHLNFGNEGQSFSLSDVGRDDDHPGSDFECYQRGPREDLQRLRFRLRTPAAGAYPCVLTDGSGKSGGTLELLPGGAYRLNGQAGRYSVDFRREQSHDWSDLDFTGGPLDEASGSYGEDRTGLRKLSVYRRKLECTQVVKPTPIPRYGTAKAPAPPKGSGGLSGAYAGWYVNPLAMTYGGCGVCWDMYVFDKAGYVYSHEPDESLDEADCTRTHPNGLPVCEVYRLQGGQIVIGGEARSFARAGRDLKIGSRTYQPLIELDGLKLSGPYESKSFVGGSMTTVSGGFQTDLTFLPGGRFTRARSGGISATTTTTGTPQGEVTGGVTVTSDRTNGGTYTVSGYTLSLKYGDGHVERLFAYALPDDSGKPDLGLLRLGGSSYTVPDKK